MKFRILLQLPLGQVWDRIGKDRQDECNRMFQLSTMVFSQGFIYCNASCMFVCVLSHSVMSDSLQSHGLQLARLLCPQNFLSKKTGMGCHCLLQGIFTMQGSNPRLLRLLHQQADSLPLCHLGSPVMIHRTYTYTYICISCIVCKKRFSFNALLN